MNDKQTQNDVLVVDNLTKISCQNERERERMNDKQTQNDVLVVDNLTKVSCQNERERE